MRINWFLPVNHTNYNRMSASVWIRCLQVIPYLERQGIHSTVNQLDAKADIHLFVRRQDDEAYLLAERAKAQGCCVIFDLVVNYFDKAALPRLGTPVTDKHVQQALRMLEVADVVTCASQFIADRASKYHDWVVYIPDSIDNRHFSYKKPKTDFYRKRIRAVWSGIVSKAFELEMILPLLQRYGIQLRIISNRWPILKACNQSPFPFFLYRFKKWRYETFPQAILEGEICLSPRFVDSPYNKGHSFFKIGVFMAQGVPAIGSPVPSYYELLNQNRGGCICKTNQEWDHILERIIDDRELLVRWSEEARSILMQFTTEKIAQKYMEIFTKLTR